MHSCTQSSQKQEHTTSQPTMCQKEPSLMPVPSPQQIQYLNAFDGQELTIQKQPNTSIRELDMMSPARYVCLSYFVSVQSFIILSG